MIIVSQPRNSITNFDNITDIELEEYENKSWIIKCYTIDDKHINLAIYKTEERAKEVLQEIVDKYKECTAIYKNKTGNYILNILEFPKVYKMPEE